MEPTIARRAFLQGLGMGVLTIPTLVISQRAWGQELPKLEESDAMAKALGYYHDSSKVDNVKYKQHKPEQLCKNCKLVQGEPKDWMPCQLFPGKAVNANGWCVGYVVKA